VVKKQVSAGCVIVEGGVGRTNHSDGEGIGVARTDRLCRRIRKSLWARKVERLKVNGLYWEQEECINFLLSNEYVQN
jgi:hypothetical protein